MKCSHPQCSRGIGLVSYRRAFTKARYCSKKCRDSYVIDRPEPSISWRHIIVGKDGHASLKSIKLI